VDRNEVEEQRRQPARRRPLTRGRGSKRGGDAGIGVARRSPAHTRAWIETLERRADPGEIQGSPAHTRAWIETRGGGDAALLGLVARSHAGVDRNGTSPSLVYLCHVARSHAGVDRNLLKRDMGGAATRRPLTRGRGSKPVWSASERQGPQVARSHAGVDRNGFEAEPLGNPEASPAHTRAWIETMATRLWPRGTPCRPLTRGRGSKPREHERRHPVDVSPAHTRAWIETSRVHPEISCQRVARSHAGVDRNKQEGTHEHCLLVARSHAGVDRNSQKIAAVVSGGASPAHTRAWIETTYGLSHPIR